MLVFSKPVLLCSLLMPSLCFAHNLTLGQPVPATKVEHDGELILSGKAISYQHWTSDQLAGKVRVIQAIAGRSSAKKKNAKLMKAITKQNFDQRQYQTTTVINQDDSLWGTSRLVKSFAETSKKAFSWSSIVLDKKGSVAEDWQLKANESTIIVLNRHAQVLFVKEGALDTTGINQVITLLNEALD